MVPTISFGISIETDADFPAEPFAALSPRSVASSVSRTTLLRICPETIPSCPPPVVHPCKELSRTCVVGGLVVGVLTCCRTCLEVRLGDFDLALRFRLTDGFVSSVLLSELPTDVAFAVSWRVSVLPSA